MPEAAGSAVSGVGAMVAQANNPLAFDEVHVADNVRHALAPSTRAARLDTSKQSPK
ncbi:hypothetical protein [Paraburkholderia sp. ZP32-5]|uniref:hypothetical protein n=1 Tax=Paraburkholderia sp. ZP32-5 TaxID=2883245 RepID=UPI001F3E78D0|nr:hypothetical protein [Paraburkholderia sp. ZP32-5]